MKTAYAKVADTPFRKFSGVNSAEPYVTGTYFIWFDALPEALAAYTAKERSGALTKENIQNLLAGACTGFTPPGGNMTPIDFNGIGSTHWGVPGTLDYGTTFSAKFIEFSKLPIYSIFHSWVKMIRDYRTGTTDLISGDDGAGYMKKTYGGGLYYFTTAPDAQSIEFSAYFDGVWPMRDPSDLFASDVESVNRLDIDMEFHFDTMYQEPWVAEKCKKFINTITTAKKNIQSYSL